MKKVLSIILSLALVLIPSYAFAYDSADFPKISDETVLYEATEISDPEVLVQRAALGINELEENTEYEITADVETVSSSGIQTFSSSSSEPLLTSQLLRSAVQEGTRTDTYVVKAVQYTSPYTVTDSSGTLVSSMYININVTLDGPAQKDGVQMVRTAATSSDDSAVRLIMTNGYKEDGDGDLITTSKQVANPGRGSYTLNACSSIWITKSMGCLYLRNNLHHNNGSITTVKFFVDKYGNKIYQ